MNDDNDKTITMTIPAAVKRPSPSGRFYGTPHPSGLNRAQRRAASRRKAREAAAPRRQRYEGRRFVRELPIDTESHAGAVSASLRPWPAPALGLTLDPVDPAKVAEFFEAPDVRADSDVSRYIDGFDFEAPEFGAPYTSRNQE